MNENGSSSVAKDKSDDTPPHKSNNGGVPLNDRAKEVRKSEDNTESSTASTESDGKGRGSGSRGGYSADCSSSDGSSLEAKKGDGKSPVAQMGRLNLSGDSAPEKSAKAELKAKPSKNGTAPKAPKTGRRSKDPGDTSLTLSSGKQDRSQGSAATGDSSRGDGNDSTSLPQWNGVRIRHPMDPRIDLSTVNHVHTASVPAFPTRVDVPSQHLLTKQAPSADVNPEPNVPHVPDPSIDQYMNLMEVVRPFFHAHGIAQHSSHPRSDEPSNERPSSDFATEQSDSDQKQQANVRKLEVPVAAWNTSRAAGMASAASHPNGNHTESDSSSLVVLARVKRKHLKKSQEDATNEPPNGSANEGANMSSSSEKKVRIQQPQVAAEEAKDDAVANNREERNGHDDPRDGNGLQDVAVAHQQETTSASSSEERNNMEPPEDAPIRYGVPAVVSEYSSSARVGSSGASNNNLTSASGSGSAGNTGSGTGSGSNQGGSSGSGNDHGGSSANGNGSSGSGNDVKGSSELDNSAENNSGDHSGGNSDESNSKKDKNKNAAAAADAPHVGAGHRHGMTVAEDAHRDPTLQPQLSQAHDGGENAAREKKLQDKKRKRMNMRREYEEKVQQEMESSESSRDRGEIFLRPGRPVTLDKVLSFTKVARIVIKAGPPFLVVYTNAAYSRLSGIDSHSAVGKPISALMSIPEQRESAALGDVARANAPENSAGERSTDRGQLQEPSSFQFDPQNAGDDAGGHTYVAAEAAGRARAASQEDNTDMCLERLVAASGFGRCHVINVVSTPHQMVGRNVSVPKQESAPGQERRSGEERSNGSSITSGFDGHYQMVPCSMGVSPVVSSPEALNAAVVTDKDQDNHHHKSKRRKHHHHNESQQATTSNHHQHRRNFLMREVSLNRKRHLITHYVIQLEPFEGTIRKFGSLESHSSTSTTAEAHILGMTKSEWRRQRVRNHASRADPPQGEDGNEGDEMESESSEPREPVTAIG